MPGEGDPIIDALLAADRAARRQDRIETVLLALLLTLNLAGLVFLAWLALLLWHTTPLHP